MMRFDNVIRNFVFSVGLAAAAGFSLWKGMPWPAVTAMVLLSAFLYRDYTRAAIKSCIAFIESARIAKFGQFEIQAERSSEGVGLDLRQLMLKNLKPEELGLLFALYPDKTHPLLNQKAKNSVVSLRDRGWITHDKDYLGDSSEIWLTEQGRAVLATVLPELSAVQHEAPKGPNASAASLPGITETMNLGTEIAKAPSALPLSNSAPATGELSAGASATSPHPGL